MKNSNISVFDSEYIPSIVKLGRFTNLIGVLFAFLPCIIPIIVFGVSPLWGAVFAGFLMQASVSGVFWFVEPISYFPVLGIPGTYISFLSGNIGNLRMPVSIAAQEAAGVKAGTDEGAIVATIGCAVSVVVNVLMLSVGVILGTSVLGLLPETVVTTLGHILPSLFGAMLAQAIVTNAKIGAVAVILAGGMLLLNRFGMLSFLPGNPSYAVIMVAVFGSILIGRKLMEKELEAKKE
jgi:hypothetical protein